jgi:hypothetical protein
VKKVEFWFSARHKSDIMDITAPDRGFLNNRKWKNFFQTAGMFCFDGGGDWYTDIPTELSSATSRYLPIPNRARGACGVWRAMCPTSNIEVN